MFTFHHERRLGFAPFAFAFPPLPLRRIRFRQGCGIGRESRGEPADLRSHVARWIRGDPRARVGLRTPREWASSHGGSRVPKRCAMLMIAAFAFCICPRLRWMTPPPWPRRNALAFARFSVGECGHSKFSRIIPNGAINPKKSSRGTSSTPRPRRCILSPWADYAADYWAEQFRTKPIDGPLFRRPAHVGPVPLPRLHVALSRRYWQGHPARREPGRSRVQGILPVADEGR